MQSFNTYISLLVYSIVGVVFVYVFYGVYLQFHVSAKQERIEELKKNWINQSQYDHSYTVSEGCRFSATYHVVKKEGDISFISVHEHKYWVQSDKSTITDIFDVIKQAEAQADILTVEYSAYGYPSSVEIDWARDASDDECFIKVSDFKRL